MVGGAASVHHRQCDRRRSGQGIAGHGIHVRSDAEDLIDGTLVLRLCGKLDVPIGPTALVDVAPVRSGRVTYFGDRQGELWNGVDRDGVEGQHQVRYVIGRPCLVELDVTTDRVDQIEIGDGVSEPPFGYGSGKNPEELMIASDASQVALWLLSPIVRIG